jgi:hypothetical protein
MASFQQGAGFRVAGSLVRKWVSPKGNFAMVTIDVYDSDRGRSKKIELRAFSADVIAAIDELRCRGTARGDGDHRPREDRRQGEEPREGGRVREMEDGPNRPGGEGRGREPRASGGTSEHAGA